MTVIKPKLKGEAEKERKNESRFMLPYNHDNGVTIVTYPTFQIYNMNNN